MILLAPSELKEWTSLRTTQITSRIVHQEDGGPNIHPLAPILSGLSVALGVVTLPASNGVNSPPSEKTLEQNAGDP